MRTILKTDTQTSSKVNAAKKALDFVKDGMIIGLGSGSTAAYFIEFLGEKIKKEKLNVIGVPTSIESENIGKKFGIKIVQPNDIEKIDLAVDGTDEIDKNNFLIKGGGGYLTREKIIDYAAEKFIVVADDSKLVKHLGEKFPVPVEVIPFAWKFVKKKLEESGDVVLRSKDKKIYVTDNGNYILDVRFNEITDPIKLESELKRMQGVIENGIFTKKPHKIIVGKPDSVAIL
jgi:ribose 5-phosphate isomerase A